MTSSKDPFDTATLSDALDRLGIAGQARGIAPLATRFRVAGPAFTVRLVPTSGRGGTVGDFVDDVEPGAVVVLDNSGRRDVTVWGELLTEAAARRGLAGTVIHGVCRDAARIHALDYPVFARGVHTRTGKDRVRAEATGEVVSLGAASVAPGDLVVGDADGVVVIPRERREEMLALAREIEAAEARIRAAVRAGGSLREARERAGYHRLQRTDSDP